MENYRPINFLRFFEKYLKETCFKDLFNYFHKNELFTKCQSGFLPGDSSISLLLSIVHDINSSFDCDPTQGFRHILLDISKAFDKIWYDGLLFKLWTYGLKGEPLDLFRHNLREWLDLFLGVDKVWSSKGSVLGPLLFLIYINDLPDNIPSTIKIYADGTSLFSYVFEKYKSESVLNNDLQVISNRDFQWKIQINSDPKKQAQEVYFSKKNQKLKTLFLQHLIMRKLYLLY